MSRLKDCPFCGGRPIIKLNSFKDSECHYYDWHIRCKGCSVEMRIPADNYYNRGFYTKDEAIKIWNRRAKKMTPEEINNLKYKVCCPLCDNDKCVRGTDKCEAEIWARQKEKEYEDNNT